MKSRLQPPKRHTIPSTDEHDQTFFSEANRRSNFLAASSCPSLAVSLLQTAKSGRRNEPISSQSVNFLLFGSPAAIVTGEPTLVTCDFSLTKKKIAKKVSAFNPLSPPRNARNRLIHFGSARGSVASSDRTCRHTRAKRRQYVLVIIARQVNNK